MWTNRSNEVRFKDIENWIVSDAENYYFITAKKHQEISSESVENIKTPHYLECKDRKTLQSKWKVKVAGDDVYGFPQRIIIYKDYIFVFIRASLSMICIDKSSGSICWIFNAQSLIPYVSLPDETHHNNSVLGLSRVSLKHMNGNYLVVNVYSFDTRAKTDNPYLFSKTLDRDYLLSLDGKVIREVSDADSYYQDLYFFQNSSEYGMKSTIDGGIQWRKQFSQANTQEEDIVDLGNDNEKKNVFYFTKNFLIQRGLVTDNNKINTTITLLDYQNGTEVWKKTLPIFVYSFKDYLGSIYMFCSKKESSSNADVMDDLLVARINPNLPQEEIFPFVSICEDWDIERNIYGEFELVSIKDKVFMFFGNGFSVLDNGKASFFTYKALDETWTIPDYSVFFG